MKSVAGWRERGARGATRPTANKKARIVNSGNRTGIYGQKVGIAAIGVNAI
jgi:hypothetical protein